MLHNRRLVLSPVVASVWVWFDKPELYIPQIKAHDTDNICEVGVLFTLNLPDTVICGGTMGQRDLGTFRLQS